MNFNIRGEFTNIFNRTYLNNPANTASANPQAAASCKAAGGSNGSCFGTINTSTVAFPPRTGQIVARFEF